jgi:hypothetical protein
MCYSGFIVALAQSIIVCDHETLSERYCIAVSPPSDPSMPPVFAISDCFLAFADINVSSNKF